ncbi:MAG: hypothetical protein DCC75_08185 [Proteobacteria bacterium]|nr:MAG: hypothetical protein DCC75_08185 [Pseudomonadota bacterium]
MTLNISDQDYYTFPATRNIGVIWSDGAYHGGAVQWCNLDGCTAFKAAGANRRTEHGGWQFVTTIGRILRAGCSGDTCYETKVFNTTGTGRTLMIYNGEWPYHSHVATCNFAFSCAYSATGAPSARTGSMWLPGYGEWITAVWMPYS